MQVRALNRSRPGDVLRRDTQQVDRLTDILEQLRVMNQHLALITGVDFTVEDTRDDD